MCIFSGEVNDVHTTKIFAQVKDGWQCLVYEMYVSSDDPVAMILPFPCTDDSPAFVNLEELPGFFKILERSFPAEPVSRDLGAMCFGATLDVEEVGSFIGSFVPTVNDLDRIDPRFRLSSAALEEMRTRYSRGYSFAVFQLKEGDHDIHPMAFKFRSATPKTAFFPTLHIHDGEVHTHESFDHTLYLQAELSAATSRNEGEWEASIKDLRQGISERSQYLAVEGPAFRRKIQGNLPNQDTLVAVA